MVEELRSLSEKLRGPVDSFMQETLSGVQTHDEGVLPDVL